MNRLLAILAFMGTLVLVPQVAAQPTPQALDGVWAEEEMYWNYFARGDDAGYRTLFHERFAGWPCGQEKPVFAPIPLPQGAKVSYALLDKASTGGPGLVIVYYRAVIRSEYPDGRSEATVRRFTHTWIQTGNVWKILGGMCTAEAQ